MRELRKHELPFLPQAQVPGGERAGAQAPESSPGRTFGGGPLPLNVFWPFLATPSPSEDAVPPPGVSSVGLLSSQGGRSQPPHRQGFSSVGVLPSICPYTEFLTVLQAVVPLFHLSPLAYEIPGRHPYLGMCSGLAGVVPEEGRHGPVLVLRFHGL